MTNESRPLAGAVKMLSEQDREYNRKTNMLMRNLAC